jgi:glyoxylate/hydroxypyruvate reductase A
MRVVLNIPTDADPCWLELFRAALPGAQVYSRASGQPVDPNAVAADYVIAYGRETLFDEQRGMKAIFTLSAGVRQLLKLPNLPRNVPLIRLEDAGMAEQMVRYALAAALRSCNASTLTRASSVTRAGNNMSHCRPRRSAPE